MPWTETTISITQNELWQQLLILQISTLKGNLLRLRDPGFLISLSIVSGCFNFFFCQPLS